MTERGIKNIANVSMIIGLLGAIYFGNKSQILTIVGAVMMVAGIITQMFFKLKRFR